MTHDRSKLKRNLNRTIFINNNTSLDCLHSKGGVQFFHIDPPNCIYLFLPLK